MPSIVITGLSAATKRPGFFGQVVFAAGKRSLSSIPLDLLLVGNKTTAGAMTADSSPVQIFSADDVDAQAGPGSELAMLAYGCDGLGGALNVPGVNANIWLGCVAESAGAQATLTITITGTWTGTGSVAYRLSGVAIPPVDIASTDTVSTVAAKIRDAINSRPRLFATASASLGVVTVTVRNKGPRGNTHVGYQDQSLVPSGFVSTITGGASVTGGGVKFTGGTTGDDPTNLIAAISATQFDRIAIACGDQTSDAANLAKWKTAINNAAAPSIGIFEFLSVFSTSTLSNAASLSQTTLNHAQFDVKWAPNAETHPSAWNGAWGALRCLTEQVDPGAAYDGVVIPNCVPSQQQADFPNIPTVETALGEGVCPIVTNSDGTGSVVRSITAYSLNGSAPDYRVLDTSIPVVTVTVEQLIKSDWVTDFQPNNPRVRSEPDPEEKVPPAGVAYPSLWAARIASILQSLEFGDLYPQPLLVNTAAHPPQVNYDTVGKFLVADADIEPMPSLHQSGVLVRNVANG